MRAGTTRGKCPPLLALALGTVLALPSAAFAGSNNKTAVALPSLAPTIARVAPAVVDVAALTRPKLAARKDVLAGASAPGSVGRLLRHFFSKSASAGVGGHVAAIGSGFIVDPRGYIVTSNELAAKGDDIEVTLANHTKYRAQVIGRDDTTDLALIKIDAQGRLPYLNWGDSSTASVGDWIIAIGNSYGLPGTVTAGIISAKGRSLAGSYDDLMQVDAPINRGDSGGPTLSLDGRVVGVTTALYSPSGGSAGIGFAVPSNVARKVIGELRAHGHATWGWLGASLRPVPPALARRLGLDRDRPQGMLVVAVVPNGPAARAGLRPGDVITAVAGQPILSRQQLPRLIERAPVGAKLALAVRCRGKRWTARATVAERPTKAQLVALLSPGAGHWQALGMRLAPVSAGAPGRRGGLAVTRVAPKSAAAAAGILPGDVIVSIDRDPVGSPQRAAAELSAISGKIMLQVERRGSDHKVALSAGGLKTNGAETASNSG